VLETYENTLALVQCQLDTGRTHQIRVHFSHHGYPLVGDPTYGRPRKLKDESLAELTREYKRQALHAAKLGLKHPRTGEEMLFEAPWPEDFTHLVNVLRSENAAY
jgi:23S rRNA pseudouridine1911/1915/1917 synthase